jgi:hypothetical protein
MAPNVVKELALQLFDSVSEPCGAYADNIECWRTVAASVCLEGIFAEGFQDPLNL